jgi:hypothetical protein
MNGIGVVNITLLRPMALDLYGSNRSTGGFILIDPETNATVAAGMVTAIADHGVPGNDSAGPVTTRERAARWGHRGGVLELSGSAEVVDQIERSLFLHGVITVRVDAADPSGGAGAELAKLVVNSIVDSGLVALAINETDSEDLLARVNNDQVVVNAGEVCKVIASVNELLERAGICMSHGQVDWEI